MSSLVTNPYVGPRTFSKEEGHLFFGREREALDLRALVISNQLVLFYAQSGAGKSSLINTRLVPSLEQKEFEVLPVARVGGDAPEGVEVKNIYVYNLMHNLLQCKVDPHLLANLPLSKFLDFLSRNQSGLFCYDEAEHETEGAENLTLLRRALIIDQFEELFSMHPEAWKKREDFFCQLADAMKADPYLWVVLVMREDYIASLDPYAHLVPGGLRTRYYMQRLEHDAAVEAIKNPVEKLRPFAEGVAEKLADDLSRIKMQKTDTTDTNDDSSTSFEFGQYVEPVQLQVVCHNLWHELMLRDPDGHEITLQQLQDIGDVDQTLGKYYAERVKRVAQEKQVQESAIRNWFQHTLITPDGIRNIVTQSASLGLAPDVIQALHSDLVRSERRGGVIVYELTHDRLVEPIRADNKIWFDKNSSLFQQQAKLWNEKGKNESLLLTDQVLADAEIWVQQHHDELTDVEQAFLAACRRHQEQILAERETQRRELEMANNLAAEQQRSAQRARRFSIIAIGLVIIAIFGIVAALIARQDAVNSAEKARISATEADTARLAAVGAQAEARSSELSTIALERSSSQLDLAMLLGLQADSISDSNSRTQDALVAILQKSGQYRGIVKRDKDIQSVQFSPDGEVFAVLDKAGITFWRAATLDPLQAGSEPINGHFSGVTALALSKDESILVSGAVDGTIVVWNAKERKTLGAPFNSEHTSQISSLALSSNGKTLASVNWQDRAILLWDLTNPGSPKQSGNLVSDTSGGFPVSIAFSPDDKTLVSGSSDGKITLWNLSEHKSIGPSQPAHTSWVRSLAFSGELLVSGGDEGNIILWDVSDLSKPKKQGEVSSERGTIYSIALSLKNDLMATGNADGSITLWSISNLKQPSKRHEIEAIEEGYINITSLAFSEDGNTLASSTNDGAVVLWDVSGPGQPDKISKLASGQSGSVNNVILSRDGKILITDSLDTTITYWDLTNPKAPEKIAPPLKGHPGQPYGIAFSGDGSLLSSYGSDSPHPLLIDVQQQKIIGFGDVLGLSADKSIVVYETADSSTGDTTFYTFYMKDVPTGGLIGEPLQAEEAAFSPDLTKLVFQFSDRNNSQSRIQVWDLKSRKPLGSFPGSFIAFSPDSSALAYKVLIPETKQSLLRLWDISSASSTGPDIDSSYYSFGANGKTLILQQVNDDTSQSQFTFWNTAESIDATTDPTSVFSLSQNQKVLAFATFDASDGTSSINIWETASGTARFEPVDVGKGYISDLRLSSDGNVLLYTRVDNENKASVTAINTLTGKPLADENPGNIQNSREYGPVWVYEIYNYDNNKETHALVLINTASFTKISELSPGILLDLSQDGKTLIYQVSEANSNNLYVWNTLQNYPVLGPLAGNYVGLFQDDKLLAYQTYENDGAYVHLYDLTSNRKIGESIRGNYQALSADKNLLVTQSGTSSITFWNISQTWPLGEQVGDKTYSASSAALSPDGKTLVLADANGVGSYNITNGELMGKPFNVHHAGRVDQVAFSPDRRNLLTVGEDSKTIVWDLKTFERISEPLDGTSAAFSPDGNFVSVVDANNMVTLWSITSQKTLGEPVPGNGVTFSPHSKFAAIYDAASGGFTVLNLTTLKTLGLVYGQNTIFSPDDKFLSVHLDSTNTTVVYDAATLQVAKSIDGILNFVPDSDYFVMFDGAQSAASFWSWKTLEPASNPIKGTDASVIGYPLYALVVHEQTNRTTTTTIWDPFTLKQIGDTLTGIYSPSFSPDGTLISMGDEGRKQTIIWDLKNHRQIGRAIPGYFTPTFCQTNERISFQDLDTGSIKVFDLTSGKFIGEDILNRVVSFSPNCKKAALLDAFDRSITLMDLLTGKISETSIEGDTAIFSMDSTKMVVGNSGAGNTTFWSVATLKQFGNTATTYDSIYVSPGNTDVLQLYINSDTGIPTTLWNINTGTQIGAETYPWAYSPIYLPDGALVAYGTKGVTIWDLKDNSLRATLQGHSSPVTHLLFSSDGKMLASLAGDGIVLTTDLETHASFHLGDEKYSGQFTDQMAFDESGSQFRAVGSDGTIFVWGVATNPPALLDTKNAPYKDTATPSRFAISPNGKYLVYELANGADDALRIWDIDHERDYAEAIPIENCCGGAIAFSPDSRTMFYNDGETINQWDFDRKTVVARVPVEQQNSLSNLNLIMGPDAPRFLLSKFADAYGNYQSQIWDWTKHSKVGSPMSGDLRILGFNNSEGTVFYLDSFGKLIRWKWNQNSAGWRDLLCPLARRNLTQEEWQLYFRGETYPSQLACPEYPPGK